MFLSLIPHKEDRFILSTIPVIILVSANVYTFFLDKIPFITKWYLLLSTIYELITNIAFFNFHRRLHSPLEYIKLSDKDPHSLYQSLRYDVPLHSWMH
jgi:hypothetical protein